MAVKKWITIKKKNYRLTETDSQNQVGLRFKAPFHALKHFIKSYNRYIDIFTIFFLKEKINFKSDI